MNVEKILEVSKDGIVLVETANGLGVRYDAPKDPRELVQKRKDVAEYLIKSSIKYLAGGFGK